MCVPVHVHCCSKSCGDVFAIMRCAGTATMLRTSVLRCVCQRWGRRLLVGRSAAATHSRNFRTRGEPARHRQDEKTMTHGGVTKTRFRTHTHTHTLHCPEKVMQLVQVASNRPKSAQNPSPDLSRGPSDAVFHPGSVSDGPGARKRPPVAENNEKPKS